MSKNVLIDTTCIVCDNSGRMFVEQKEVECVDEIREIVTFLKQKKYLWSISKIRLQKKEFGKSRSSAPIIGVSFLHGLHNVINGSKNEKSMFYIDGDVSDKGLEGRLIANYNGRKDEIDFQLWEVLPLDLPTYYIHGIYNKHKKIFTHFDGALIDINEETKQKMQWKPFIPGKDFLYKKLFRLDGDISIKDAMEIMDRYLLLEDLNHEYGIYPPIKEISV